MTVNILVGDCRDILPRMEAGSINCCVTSPPYWRLRDYGVDGQIGMEGLPGDYISELVGVFGEVYRVLRSDGTLWLNIGDSYRAKSLVGLPWRLAFALQDRGWYLRAEIIWVKPNAMPESVTDRPTRAHEQVFLLSKSPRYFFDADAIRERPLAEDSPINAARADRAKDSKKAGRAVPPRHKKYANSDRAGLDDTGRGHGRASRSVWSIATRPFRGDHFATFPVALAERCILSGCPAGGVVLDPFAGSGTAGLVADRLQRHALLCEINPAYAAMARRRITRDSGMFSDVHEELSS